MKGSFRIAKIGDIDVGVHYSWVLVFLLVAWTLAEGVFPAEFPGLGVGTYWGMGFVSSLLLFVSVVIHELAHSFTAESRGLRVRDITLFIFGGVSNIREEPRSARDELLIAVVGPVASLVLAAVFWWLSRLAITAPDPINGVVGYLAGVNLILGLFNLIPGFPLDGGRVFRALVWAITGSLPRATRVAVAVGRGVSILFVLGGLFMIVEGGAFISGVWMIFIAWFLNNAAEAAGQQTVAMEQFRGITIRRLMHSEPRTVDPNSTVADLVWSRLLDRGQRFVPVAEDGRLAGMVTLKDVRRVPQNRWSDTTVGEVMTPAGDVQAVAPDDDAASALGVMNATESDALPVIESDRLVGVVSRDDLARYLQIRHELDVPVADHEEEDRRRAA